MDSIIRHARIPTSAYPGRIESSAATHVVFTEGSCMGKLIDTLNRSGQDSGPKLGFGARGLDKAPSFMIVAQLAKLDKKRKRKGPTRIGRIRMTPTPRSHK